MTEYRDIVLCGFPRSGSSLLYALLCMSVTSHWFPQGEYSYGAIMTALGRECPKEEGEFYKSFAHVFNQEYRLDKDANTTRPFVCKQPYNIFRARDLIIPDEVPLIITIRDMRDILLSKHRAVEERGVDDYFIDADHMYTFTKDSKLQKDGPGVLSFAEAIDVVLKRRRGSDPPPIM